MSSSWTVTKSTLRSPKTYFTKRRWLRHHPPLPAPYWGPDDYSIMHYTSGTTGKPKGAVHRHRAAIQQYATGKWVLDLHETTSTGALLTPAGLPARPMACLLPGQMAFPRSSMKAVSAPAPGTIHRKVQGHRLVHRTHRHPHVHESGRTCGHKHDLSTLRHICSVGEPLNPEAVVWGLKAFNQAIHDN